MLAVIAVRFVISPQGRHCNGNATSLRSHYTRVRGSPAVSGDAFETVPRLTRLADYEAVPLQELLSKDIAVRTYLRECLLLDTLLALGSIIATAPGSRGWY